MNGIGTRDRITGSSVYGIAEANSAEGIPKYWIARQAVSKRQYLKSAQTDKTLPVFREKDNSVRRKFPPEIQPLLSP